MTIWRGWSKNSWQTPVASKLPRLLRELAVWLLIGVAVSLAVDYFRQPALPQNFSATALHTLDGQPVDLIAMSKERPLLVYVWATWCGVCRYTTPSVAAIAADGGNVMSVALRSGDNATLETWMRKKKAMMPTVNDASGELSSSLAARLSRSPPAGPAAGECACGCGWRRSVTSRQPAPGSYR